ncbi:MAG: MATE family efflux transporter [Prochlorotrichaceae cyanobacterium]
MPTPLSTPAFLPRFLRLSGLNILSNLLVPLAGLVDTAFLGHLDQLSHLAGVTLATVLFNYLYWTFGFLRMATTGLTAQALGRQDPVGLVVILWRHAGVALCIGLTLVGLQVPLGNLGFALLQGTPAVLASGQAYYHALIWGAPATLINFVLLGWWLGQGQGRMVLLLSLLLNGCNIALDALFIGHWGWASAGAGLATAASQYIALAVGILAIQRQNLPRLSSSLRRAIFNVQEMGAMIALNRDILIRTFALLSVFASFTNLSASLGTIVLSSHALLLQVVSFNSFFVDGFAFATESLAGQFYSQNDRLSLQKLLTWGLVLGLGSSGTIALTTIVGCPWILSVLTNHQSILDRSGDFVLWLFPVLTLGSIAYLFDGYFLGLTQGPILRQSSLLSALVGFAPFALWANDRQNPHLLWLALTSFMVVRSLTLGLNLRKFSPCSKTIG